MSVRVIDGTAGAHLRWRLASACAAVLIAGLMVMLWPAFAWSASPVETLARSTLVETGMPSEALGRALPVMLYLPPGYRPGEQLGFIVLLHGVGDDDSAWLRSGHIGTVADALIAGGRLPRVVIAMPTAANSWYVDSRRFGGPGDYATAIGEELPAWLVTHWHCRPDAASHAIAGYSMGGFGALRLALMHPEEWQATVAMSGAYWSNVTPTARLDERRVQAFFHGAFGRPFDARRFVAANPLTLAAILPAPPARLPAIYLVCGRQDRFGLAAEQALMARRLSALGDHVTEQLIDGYHNWDTWRRALPLALTFIGSHLH